jgi:hypothetical protein
MGEASNKLMELLMGTGLTITGVKADVVAGITDWDRVLIY